MGRLIVFCVVAFSITGLSSVVGVLPDFVNAAVGETVTFTPLLTSSQTPLNYIAWNIGVVPIVISVDGTFQPNPAYKDRVTLSVYNASLELKNVTLSDRGLYGISIIPVAGDNLTTQTTTLNVYVPVSNVIVIITNTDLVEFGSVSLYCSASGSPTSFSWFNGSALVTASDRVQFSDGGANMTIINLLRHDQRNYSCEASDPVSSDTSDEAPLFVSYGPENITMTEPPLDEYIEGSVISLSCSADSRPEAQFEWLLDGKPLLIYGAQINLKLERSGNYSCQASNSKTHNTIQSQPVVISVLEKIKNGRVTSSPDQPTEGKPANLTCDASGHAPRREWMLNNSPLIPSDNIVFLQENKVISFLNLTRKDDGIYTCTIRNDFSDQSANYPMKVNYGPEKVHVVSCLKGVEVKTASTLKLRCSAHSLPTATYVWKKDNKTVGESGEYTKANVGSSDDGVYTCEATNDVTAKTVKASCTVTVVGIAPWVIVVIVLSCIAVILLVSGGVFYAFKKKICF